MLPKVVVACSNPQLHPEETVMKVSMVGHSVSLPFTLQTPSGKKNIMKGLIVF